MTVAATATPATTATVASAVVSVVVTVVEATAAMTGLLVAPLLRGAATTLRPLVALPRLLASTTTAAATTRIRSFYDRGLAATGY
jgi:hypothetical protein